jgi:CheY-like chemotaxis protein
LPHPARETGPLEAAATPASITLEQAFDAFQRLLRGRWELRSLSHQGAELAFQLPPAEASRLREWIAHKEGAHEAATGTPPRLKVLAVDDDAMARKLIHAALAPDERLEVLEAGDGQEAWSMLDAGLVPDLMLLDVLMPGIGGLDLLRQMRLDPRFKRVPVIICTAVGDRETVLRAAPLTVKSFIIKPFEAKVLRMKTLNALELAVEPEITP